MGKVTGRNVVRVVIIDPHPLLRLAVRNVLAANEQVSIHGTASSVQTGLELLKRHEADVIISDLEIAIALNLNRLVGLATLIVLAADPAAHSVVRAISIGASSFLHKSVGPTDLTDAVLDAAHGKKTWYLGEEIDWDASDASMPSSPQATALTNREKEVFAMLLRRMTNEEIAVRLFLARQTVKNYVSSILQKLGMPTRTHLVREFAMAYKQPDTARKPSVSD